jgi:hypothetical protein
MFVNQPDDAQLVALWHDPETCPAIARRLGVSQTWLTLQWRRLRQQDRLHTDRRRRRRPADHQDARPPVEAADRGPRRAAVRLVQLEESDVFVSQSVDAVIYVARVPQWEPFLWSAIEVASDQNDRRVDVEG